MIELLQSWLLRVEAWAVLGVGLAIVETFTGAMIALPLGGAALVIAGLLWIGLITSWQQALLGFAVLGVVVALVLRRVFRKASQTPDINDY